MFYESGQNRKAAIPAATIKMEAKMYWSTHTPHTPPSIEMMNMMKRTIVREDVGKTSEAIRFAEDEAGDANMKSMTIMISRKAKDSIW